jgi:hypothetical protein
MANTNRSNPNAAAEPTRQSQGAAGKRPTESSPALRYRQYDRGGPKDPPDSLAGTSTRTKSKRTKDKRKTPPELLDAPPAIQQTNVDLSVASAALGSEEVVALPPPAVPTVRQESTDYSANIENAKAQPPWIVPQTPPIGGPSPTANMPTLLRLPESGKTPAESRQYPERSNWSPFLTPPRVINASSLGNGHDMTPLDVGSPDGATLEQVLYAENKMFGEDNDSSHKQSNVDNNSKDGNYCDHGNDEADDDSAMDLGGKGTGGKLRKRAAAVLFHYSDDDYDHLYDEDIDKDEKRIDNSGSNKRVKVGRGRVNLILGEPNPPNCDGMTPDKAVAAKKTYTIKRQKFREERRSERLRAAKGELFDKKDYTGDATPTLRPMAQVINFHLKLGHTFPVRDLVMLRIAEEATCFGPIYSRDF